MRFCCLVIALAFLAAFASDSWGQSQKFSQPQAQRAQQQAAPDQRGTQNEPVVVKVFPAQEDEKKASQDATEHEEKRQFDRDTLRLTKLTVGIIFLQLLIFVAQAYYLRGTLNATAVAAKAAIDAAALASKHERAYMFSGPAEEGGVSINYQQSTVQVKFEIENSGRTVGVLKKLCLGFTTEEPTNQTATYEGDGFKTFDFDLAFKAGIKRVYFGPRQSPLPPITTFVVGYIDYIDIFKNPHFSRFCIRIDADGSYRTTGPPAWNDWD